MILHDKRLVFFHVPKVAGTSIERAIYDKPWDTQVFNRDLFVGWHDEYGYTQHATYEQMANFYNLRDYFKFCFVRNPWDRMVSAYCYAVRVQGYDGEFTEFVAGAYGLVITKSYRPGHHVAPQLDYISHIDFIGRYERLQEDWQVVAGRYGFAKTLQHCNRSRRQHYGHYYTDKTERLVAAMYEEEIELFKYCF
jgi:hypothetical protein